MRVKIGTYNIQHGKKYSRFLETGEEKIDLLGVADVIRDAGVTICGLNEVRNQETVPGLCNQVKVIAEALGYHYVFAKAIDLRNGGVYGNALVSKYPILHWRTVPIAVPEAERVERKHKYENRVLLIAEIEVEGRMLTVLICHFGLNPDEIDEAVETIRRELSALETPIVLMGDFNLTPDTDSYTQLASLLRDTAREPERPLTFPSDKPDRKIDYVFVSKDVISSDVCVPAILQSDHRPYFLQIDF